MAETNYKLTPPGHSRQAKEKISNKIPKLQRSVINNQGCSPL